jgi:superoxide dismutase, Fe-Mn family
MENNNFALPELSYGYKDLEPYISEEQLRIHHQKHHQSYVNGANEIFEKLTSARIENIDLDMKAALKALSFNVGGHILHSLYWKNLAIPDETNQPSGRIGEEITDIFGSIECFKKEFTQAASSVEGSGWAALAICPQKKHLLIMQIEKHNINLIPQFKILLVVDVFEHAYYLDYKNDRGKYLENIWKLVDWGAVNQRLEK